MAQNVADLMWQMLGDAGVKGCYGIVGHALNPVIDALHRNGKIEFVHGRKAPQAFSTIALTAGPVATPLAVGTMSTLPRAAAVWDGLATASSSIRRLRLVQLNPRQESA